MPKGDIRFKNGTSVHFDDVSREGKLVVFKRSYSHDVQAVPASEVKSIAVNEWHQSPFGSCKSLGEKEVDRAIDRYTGH